ncbi:MAG: TfoX/Sxy family protein [Fimbriimonadaceae bacterium]|nr:TfoX/Sxy family protein [Alphaproteobacteria bacterium]
MSVSPEYKEFIIELLLPFGDVQIKSMFGGGGVYYQGTMFGLIADETLYLKADQTTIPDFESEGMDPFMYEGKSGKPIRMSYWQAPERLYEDGDEMKSWAMKSYEIARSGKKSPKKRK